MNKRARTVLTNIVDLQDQAADALQMLLDNPDDAELDAHQDRLLRSLHDGQRIHQDALRALLAGN
jgi:hypothetical protein